MMYDAPASVLDKDPLVDFFDRAVASSVSLTTLAGWSAHDGFPAAYSDSGLPLIHNSFFVDAHVRASRMPIVLHHTDQNLWVVLYPFVDRTHGQDHTATGVWFPLAPRYPLDKALAHHIGFLRYVDTPAQGLLYWLRALRQTHRTFFPVEDVEILLAGEILAQHGDAQGLWYYHKNVPDKVVSRQHLQWILTHTSSVSALISELTCQAATLSRTFGATLSSYREFSLNIPSTAHARLAILHHAAHIRNLRLDAS